MNPAPSIALAEDMGMVRGYDSAMLAGAIALALGIGLQNCPEGTAVAVPCSTDAATLGAMVGFAVMMTLDVALG